MSKNEISFKSEKLEKYKDFSDKIKEELLYNEDTKTIKEKESRSAYLKNLPEGITPDTIETISKYNGRFVTAAHIATGEMAAEVFKKNKNIDHIEAEIGYFGKNDTINISIDREKEYVNHLAKNPEDQKVIKHLVMNTTVTTSSAKGTGLKPVKDVMSEEFKDMFNK